MERSVISCPFCSNKYHFHSYANHRIICFKNYYLNRMNVLSNQLGFKNQPIVKTQNPNIKINIDLEKPHPSTPNLNKINFKIQPFQKKYEPIQTEPKINNSKNNEIIQPTNPTKKPEIIIQKNQKPIQHLPPKNGSEQDLITQTKVEEKKYQLQIIDNKKNSKNIKYDPDSKFIFYKEQSYEEYLKNKRIIIVGPAQSVLKNSREFIESFDIIVRLNKSLPISEKLIPNIGLRTDILYNNLNLNDDPGRNRIPNHILEKYGVKYVACPYPPIHPFLPDIIYFLNQNKKKVSFHHIPTAFYRKIEANIQTRPNTGLCAILDILRYPIKELYITGITFFTDGYYNQYKDIKNFSMFYSQMNDGIHKQSPQREILRNMYLMDTRIKVDKNLNSILLHRFDSFQKDLKNIFLEQKYGINLIYNNLLGQNINLFSNQNGFYQIIQNYDTKNYSNLTDVPRIYINPIDYFNINQNDIIVLTNFNNWNDENIIKAKGIFMLISPSQFWVDNLQNEFLSKIFVINSIQIKKYNQLINKVDFQKDLSFIMFLIHIITLNGCKIECSYFNTLQFSNNPNQNRKELLFLRYLEKKEYLFKFNSNNQLN